MMNISRIIVVGVLGLVASGCTTTSSRFINADEVSAYLISKTPAQIQSQLGTPRTVKDLGFGKSVWTYHSDMIQHKKPTQGKCEMIITFEGEQAVNVAVNATEYSPFAAPLATCNQMLGDR